MTTLAATSATKAISTRALQVRPVGRPHIGPEIPQRRRTCGRDPPMTFGVLSSAISSASRRRGAAVGPATSATISSRSARERGEGGGIEHVARAHAVAAEADEPGLLQDLQMLRDGRLGERQAAADVGAATAAPLRQRAHDGEPHRMAERLQPLGGVVTLHRFSHFDFVRAWRPAQSAREAASAR